MIEIEYTKHFLKSAKKLQKSQQSKLVVLLEKMSKHPFSPLLHTKQLSSTLTGFYSFRISRDYRAIFQFLGPLRIKLIDVAHRKDIYR